MSAGSPPAAPTTVSPSALDSGGVVGTATASPAPSAAAAAAATAPPTASGAPTTTRPPDYGGVDVPATFSFVASVMGEVNAEEVLAGETNQVKLTLEEQLLALCDEVIAGEESGRRRRRTSAGGGVGRMLVVDKCVLATVDDVGDVGECVTFAPPRDKRMAGTFVLASDLPPGPASFHPGSSSDVFLPTSLAIAPPSRRLPRGRR